MCVCARLDKYSRRNWLSLFLSFSRVCVYLVHPICMIVMFAHCFRFFFIVEMHFQSRVGSQWMGARKRQKSWAWAWDYEIDRVCRAKRIEGKIHGTKIAFNRSIWYAHCCVWESFSSIYFISCVTIFPLESTVEEWKLTERGSERCLHRANKYL